MKTHFAVLRSMGINAKNLEKGNRSLFEKIQRLSRPQPTADASGQKPVESVECNSTQEPDSGKMSKNSLDGSNE